MSVTVYEPTGIVHSVIAHLGDTRTMTSVVHLTQYDNTLPTIAVKLMNGAQPYKIAESATVSIRVGKPDKTGVYNPCLGVSADYTTAYFAATEQMCAADGKAFAVVEIIDGGTASTGVFVIDIAENPVNDETVLSDSELGIIQTLVDEAKNAAQTAAEEAAQEAVTQVQTQIDQKVTDAVTKQKNMVFVDKQIGTAITEEQSEAIKAGTFTGLNIGNYWLSGGIKYRIAGFDIFYKCGDNVSLGHHVVVVPDTCIKNGDGSTTHWMQDTDTTTGGYVGSKMYKDTLPNTILPIIEGIFGSHILQHREILSNATSGGLASGWAWYDRKVDLMCEHMLYGASVWGNGKYNVGIGARQLPIFRMAHNLIHADRNAFWLRDVVSSTNFAYCNYYGYAHDFGASLTWVGVRPYFLLQ